MIRSMTLGLLATSLVACLLVSSARSSETIETNTGGNKARIVATKATTGGWFSYDTWDVRAIFNIRRAVKPTTTIYFEVCLREVDVAFDDVVAKKIVSVSPANWSPRAGGGFSASKNVLFSKVSEFYGVDWEVNGEDVCEVPCPDEVAHLGGGVQDEGGGSFGYRYVVYNDPDLIGMDPSATISQVSIAGVNIPIAPALARGDSVEVMFSDSRPPNPYVSKGDSDSTTAFAVSFTGGQVVSGRGVGPGIAVGPFMPEPLDLPIQSPLGAVLLVSGLAALGGLVLSRRFSTSSLPRA